MDSLSAICADIIQLRDEVAQSEFRPAADDICNRLTMLAGRIEACETQPRSGVVAYEITDRGAPTHSTGTIPEESRETHAETSGKKVSHRASVRTGKKS